MAISGHSQSCTVFSGVWGGSELLLGFNNLSICFVLPTVFRVRSSNAEVKVDRTSLRHWEPLSVFPFGIEARAFVMAADMETDGGAWSTLWSAFSSAALSTAHGHRTCDLTWHNEIFHRYFDWELTMQSGRERMKGQSKPDLREHPSSIHQSEIYPLLTLPRSSLKEQWCKTLQEHRVYRWYVWYMVLLYNIKDKYVRYVGICDSSGYCRPDGG